MSDAPESVPPENQFVISITATGVVGRGDGPDALPTPDEKDTP